MYELPPATPSAPRYGDGSAYAELKRRIEAAGLLEFQPRFYWYKTSTSFALLALSLAVLVFARRPLFVLFDAPILALVFGQISNLLHESCHNIVCATPRRNAILSAILGDLITGTGWRWWQVSHNAHHVTSNLVGVDPDMEYPFFLMDEQQIGHLSRKGVSRLQLFVMQHQHLLAWPLMMLGPGALKYRTVEYLRRTAEPSRKYEVGLLIAHWALYLGLLFGVHGLWLGLAFLLLQEACAGIYLGLDTTPGHWGMPMLMPGRIEFVRLQVTTTRNVVGNPLVEFILAGGNRQIEHHLFPKMARNNLPAAAEIVREFCAERGISYNATSFSAGIRDVYRGLSRCAVAARVNAPQLRAALQPAPAAS